jgi:hypothetical protein
MLARVHSSDGGCQWLSGRLAGSGFIAYARAEHSYIWVPDETCESPDVCRVGVMQRRHEGVKPLIYVQADGSDRMWSGMRMPMGVDFICRQTTWARSRCRCSEKGEMNVIRKWKELMSQDMVSDPCMHLTRPILFDSHASTSSLARSVLLGRINVSTVHVTTMRCVLSRATTTTVTGCVSKSPVFDARLYLYQCSGRSASALPSFNTLSCSRRRQYGYRGAHSRAIDWQWRRRAFSYRLYCLCYCCSRPPRALGKASLGPFLYIYISPHIIISTHCYPQEIATLTLRYTRI